MKPLAIIQARMGSTRLKDKSLKEICGRPLLEYVVRRTARALPEPVLALPDSKKDDVLAEKAADWPCRIVRGPEEDVLGRFIKVLEQFPGADPIVRVTGDNPFISPRLIESAVKNLKKDWGAFNLTPLGTGAGVFRRKWLEKADRAATSQREREHVTLWIKQKSAARGIKWYPPEEFRAPAYRLTVDTGADLKLARKIQGNFREHGWFTPVPKIIERLTENKGLGQINSPVEQKNYTAPSKRILYCLNRGQEWGHGHWERAKFITERLAQINSANWIFLLLGDVGEPPLEVNQPVSTEEFFPATPQVINRSTCELSGSIIREWRRRTDANVVILDRKFSSGELIRAMKKEDAHVIGLEERGAGRPELDAVFDPNLYPDSLENESLPPEKLFYGPDYAFLNPEFKQHSISEIPLKITDVGLSFGGTDPRNLGQLFFAQVAPDFPRLTFHHYGPEMDGIYPENVTYEGYVEQPAEAFGAMDLMVNAGGLTKFEVACLQIPAMIIAQNEEQYENSQRFINKNNLGWPLFMPETEPDKISAEFAKLLEVDRWKNIHRATKEVVDGKATERLTEYIRKLDVAKN